MLLVGLSGCVETSQTAKTGDLSDKSDTRYIRVRRLLEKSTLNPERVARLKALVQPICVAGEEQSQFLDTLRWSVGFSEDTFYLPTKLAIEVLEYVSNVCGAAFPKQTVALLEQAERILPKDPRLKMLIARTLAVIGRLSEASKVAQSAVPLGDPQAVALAAHIEAQRARQNSGAYEPGMYARALELTETPPGPNWHAVDLAAVLATRARLFLEVDFWTLPNTSPFQDPIRALLKRTVEGPFPAAVKLRAADLLCMESQWQASAGDKVALEGCKAAADLGHAWATWLLGARSEPLFPKLRRKLDTLAPGDEVVVVVKGPESEIMEWAKALVVLLKGLSRRGAHVLLVDRTQTDRSTRVVEHIFKLANVRPRLVIPLRGTSSSVTCVSALSAQHQRPHTCDLSPEITQEFSELSPPKFTLLVGRDLDTEIDDFRLYNHPTALASFRRSEVAHKVSLAWLKSVSDVWALEL